MQQGSGLASILIEVYDHFKTQVICDTAVKDDSFSLQFVPDWYVTRVWVDMWHDNDYDEDGDKFFEWHEGYKKRKTQKASIKEDPLPIAWHPSRYWDWCGPEDEKK